MTLDFFAGSVKAPADPILGLSEAFNADSDPKKVNLGVGMTCYHWTTSSVGAYRDEKGKPLVLNCVRTAEEELLAEHTNHEYIPMGGIEQMTTLAAALVFGDDCDAIKEQRVASVQTISGTGALMVGAKFLRKFFRAGEGIVPSIWIPDPTWDNHVAVFENSELQVHKYRYLKNGLEFNEEGMLQDIAKAADCSIILLHAWYVVMMMSLCLVHTTLLVLIQLQNHGLRSVI